MNIVIAGCQHETNTFSPIATTYEDFVQADSWPALMTDNEILSIDTDANIPISGFIKQSKNYDFNLLPLIWCSATPSGKVTQSAEEKITHSLLDQLKNINKPIDAIYLDLHGAMVTESQDDYEGYLLSEIRKMIGDQIPIVVSLDLHANVSQLMIDKSTMLVAYETYPHIDAGLTGEKCAALLHKILQSKSKPQKAFTQLPFLIPMTAQCTLNDPAQSLYQLLEKFNILSASLCMGFPLSDTYNTGPSIVCYDFDKQKANDACNKIYNAFSETEKNFQLNLLQPDEAVTTAIKLNNENKYPVILADTQDNPGCGGHSDTTGMLQALLKANAPDATLVMMADKEIAQLAHEKGINQTIHVTFKDASNSPSHPVKITCDIIALGDGNMIGSGPFYNKCAISLGPMACLKYQGIKIIVSSKKMQAADQSILRHLNIDPKKEKIIVLKSSVHFRADFMSISDHIFVAEAPGLNTADLKKLSFKKLRDGVRY